jgi:hypothetical protein
MAYGRSFCISRLSTAEVLAKVVDEVAETNDLAQWARANPEYRLTREAMVGREPSSSSKWEREPPLSTMLLPSEGRS